MSSAPRPLPTAIAAEKAVLGALLLDAAAFDLLPKVLAAAAFTSLGHQYIYHAVETLLHAGRRVDLVSVVDHLTTVDHLDAVGGPYGVVELTNNIASSANIVYHAQLVVAAYRRRQLLVLYQRAMRAAYADELDPFHLLEEVAAALMSISGHGAVPAVPSLLHVAIVELERRSLQDTAFTGVPTGFTGIDALTLGWQPSDLIILGARPGIGKTALALQLAHAAAAAGHAVLFFSLEMSALQLTQRVLVQRAEVNTSKRPIHPSDMERLRELAPAIERLPLYIDDNPGLPLQTLRARCFRQKRLSEGLGLVVVDYLQLLTTTDHHHQREQEVGAIARGLKQLARELHVPIIALSQLTRAVDKRPDKRPQLADLRESGSLEQDADIVALLHRAEYYGIEQDEEGLPTSGRAELIFAKHRNGALGTVRLGWRSYCTRFDNLGPVAAAIYDDPEHEY